MKNKTAEKAVEIANRAGANAKERTRLINEVRDLIDSDLGFKKVIDQIDSSFVRKIISFPGDITTHRIAKTLSTALRSMFNI